MCIKSSQRIFLQNRIIQTLIGFLIIYDASVCGTIWRETTACYGADLSCSSYQITCDIGKTIVLGELKYGTKLTKPQCQFGVSNCKQLESDCCAYDRHDQFTDFSVENETVVRRNCESKSSCSGWAPRLFTSPYSSYIWIKYACVQDQKNIANMCTSHSITGYEVFLSNPQFYITSDTNSSINCSCRVTPTVCGSTIDLKVVNLDFNRPGTNTSNCSNAYIKDSGVGKTFRCLTAINVKQIRETQILRRGDVVSIRNMFKDDYRDMPKSFLFYYSSKSLISLECFSPGVETNLVDNCTNAQVTTDTVSGENSNPTVTISRSTDAPSYTRDKTITSTKSTSTVTTPSVSVPSSTVTSSSQNESTKTSTYPSTAVSTSSTQSSKVRDTSLPTMESMSRLGSTTQVPITGRTVASSPHALSESSVPVTTISSNDQSSEQPLTPNYTHMSTSPLTSSILSSSVSFMTTHTIHHGKNSTTSTMPVTPGHTVGGTSRSSGPELVVTDATTIDATVGISDGGGDGNKSLIIGITIGAILLVAIIAALVMFCFCIQLKRKEKARRNYIQNTNIFYSFPEDASDTEATESDAKYSDLPSYTINQHYDSYDNQSTSTTNPLRLDAYKINKSLAAENSNTRLEGVSPGVKNGQVRHAGHSADMVNETMDFVNGTEDVSGSRSTGLDVNMNGGKSVTFDPSALYSEVRKEGKTKF